MHGIAPRSYPRPYCRSLVFLLCSYDALQPNGAGMRKGSHAAWMAGFAAISMQRGRSLQQPVAQSRDAERMPNRHKKIKRMHIHPLYKLDEALLLCSQVYVYISPTQRSVFIGIIGAACDEFVKDLCPCVRREACPNKRSHAGHACRTYRGASYSRRCIAAHGQ